MQLELISILNMLLIFNIHHMSLLCIAKHECVVVLLIACEHVRRCLASRMNKFKTVQTGCQEYTPSLLYLSEVVKVVFVVNPSILGSQAVGFVSDVLHIETHTVVELAFEELGRKSREKEKVREAAMEP